MTFSVLDGCKVQFLCIFHLGGILIELKLAASFTFTLFHLHHGFGWRALLKFINNTCCGIGKFGRVRTRFLSNFCLQYF